jgi:hypothetical protein
MLTSVEKRTSAAVASEDTRAIGPIAVLTASSTVQPIPALVPCTTNQTCG